VHITRTSDVSSAFLFLNLNLPVRTSIGPIVIGNSPRVAAIMQGNRSKPLDTELGKSREEKETARLTPAKSADLALSDG